MVPFSPISTVPREAAERLGQHGLAEELPHLREALAVAQEERSRAARLEVLPLALEQAGAYRLALYRRGRGWLFTNHFRLVDA